MSGAWRRSSSILQEWSCLICPHSECTVPQQKSFRIRFFESKCPLCLGHCVPYVSNDSMCLRPSSSATHTKSSPRIAILTYIFASWNNAALCLPLPSEASQFPTDQVHMAKLPNVRSILSSVHALDQPANFCLLHTSVDLPLGDEHVRVSGPFLGHVLF